MCFQKDFFFLKQEFVKVYMSSVYFLLHSPSLPSHRWADPTSEEQRASFIYATLTFLKHNQHTNSSLAGLEVFVDAAHQHLAFDVSELSFDFLSVARCQTWSHSGHILKRAKVTPKCLRVCDQGKCSDSLHQDSAQNHKETKMFILSW